MAAMQFMDASIVPDWDGGDRLGDFPELKALYALWNAAKKDRPMPSRRDFTPELLRPWLGNLALIDVIHNPIQFYYRLVGIYIVQNLKCDPTGKTFSDIVADPANDPATQGAYRCLVLTEPVLEVVQPRGNGHFAFDCARLSLPLSADGQTINMILMGEYNISRAADTPSPDNRSGVFAKAWN